MITFNELMRVLRNMVIRFPIVEGRLNTFSYLKEGADIEHPTFGAVYEDYLDGLYFDRDWNKKGAERSAMIGSKDALVVESKDARMQPSNVKVLRKRIDLSSILSIEQNGKPTTRQRLASWNERNLRTIIHGLNHVYQYSYTDAGGMKSAWLSEEEAAYLASVDGVSQVSQGMRLSLMQDPIDVMEINWNYKSVASSMCTFYVDVCEEVLELSSSANLDDYSAKFITNV